MDVQLLPFQEHVVIGCLAPIKQSPVNAEGHLILEKLWRIFYHFRLLLVQDPIGVSHAFALMRRSGSYSGDRNTYLAVERLHHIFCQLLETSRDDFRTTVRFCAVVERLRYVPGPIEVDFDLHNSLYSLRNAFETTLLTPIRLFLNSKKESSESRSAPKKTFDDVFWDPEANYPYAEARRSAPKNFFDDTFLDPDGDYPYAEVHHSAEAPYTRVAPHSGLDLEDDTDESELHAALCFDVGPKQLSATPEFSERMQIGSGLKKIVPMPNSFAIPSIPDAVFKHFISFLPIVYLFRLEGVSRKFFHLMEEEFNKRGCTDAAGRNSIFSKLYKPGKIKQEKDAIAREVRLIQPYQNRPLNERESGVLSMEVWNELASFATPLLMINVLVWSANFFTSWADSPCTLVLDVAYVSGTVIAYPERFKKIEESIIRIGAIQDLTKYVTEKRRLQKRALSYITPIVNSCPYRIASWVINTLRAGFSSCLRRRADQHS